MGVHCVASNGCIVGVYWECEGVHIVGAWWVPECAYSQAALAHLPTNPLTELTLVGVGPAHLGTSGTLANVLSTGNGTANGTYTDCDSGAGYCNLF